MNESDMKKQWQSPINCKEKREPKDSFDILQIKLHNPGITHGEIADKYGYDYNRIKHLSHSYFHSARVDTFMREELQQVVPTIVHNVHQVFKSYGSRVDREQRLFSDHVTIVDQLQGGILRKLEAGEQPTKEEYLAYGVQLDKLSKHDLTEARVVSEFAKALEYLSGADIVEQNNGMSEPARRFIEIMEDMRANQK